MEFVVPMMTETIAMRSVASRDTFAICYRWTAGLRQELDEVPNTVFMRLLDIL